MVQFSGVFPSAAAERNCMGRLASDEARINRDELARLYDAGADMIGDLRYHYLWRLAQLEQTTATLARRSAEAATTEHLRRLRTTIATLALKAVELRQEARLLLNAYQRAAEVRAESRNHAVEAELEALAFPAAVGA